MKIHRKGSYISGARSLSRQIVLVENRLDRRKKAASGIALSLGDRIRSEMASPGGLWIAGCAGFLLADWVHRPNAGTSPVREESSAPPQRTQSTPFPNALLLLKLALDLKTRLASANPGGTPPRTK